MAKQISINTYKALLSQWSTLTEVAELCDISPNNVVQWRRRNRIPPKYWRKLIADLPNQGIEGFTLEMMLDLEEAYKPKKTKRKKKRFLGETVGPL